MLLTLLSIVATSILTVVMLTFYIKATLPGILSDVAIGAGESVTNKIKETLADPNVKRAMSVLGQKSGEVRANDALRTKVADKILDGIPSIGFVLDQLDLTPTEGLQLLNDPLIGPYIRQIVQGGLKGLTGSFKQGMHARSNTEKGFSVLSP